LFFCLTSVEIVHEVGLPYSTYAVAVPLIIMPSDTKSADCTKKTGAVVTAAGHYSLPEAEDAAGGGTVTIAMPLNMHLTERSPA
jgi:hypothetical protein